MRAPFHTLWRTAVAVVVTFAVSAPVTATAALPAAEPFRPLTIVTEPPIPGVSVVLNGTVLTTGPDGTIHTIVTKRQRDELAADRDAHLVMSTRQVALSDGTRGRFHGWYDGGYHFSPNDRSGQIEVAAFDVDYLTSFVLVDSRGARVDPRQVTSTELKDALGTTIRTRGVQPVWLLGRSVLAAFGRVTLRDVEYRFTKVMVQHVNVVHRGEQHFKPRSNSRVSVSLNLFTIRFLAQDLIFGSPRGSAIDIEMEDGTTRHFALREGAATVRGLPPGKYVVTTKALGLGREQTFAFSKDDTARIQIIDPLDAGVMLAALALIGGALILAGRRMRRRRRRQAASAGDASIAPSAREPVSSRITSGMGPR